MATQTILLHPQRKRATLDLIEKRPGIETLEISRELGLTLMQEFRILADLHGAGMIEHYQDGWRLISPGAPHAA